MGILSFGLGMCAGYYIRNRPVGREIEKICLAVFKVIKDQQLTHPKLVLVVRDDLNMTKGKIASQCSHASVLAYKSATTSHPEIANQWEVFGQSKIVLKITSEKKLTELSDQAKKLGLITNIVCDAGRTEVTPGTKTVLAIGPGPKEIIDKVTAQLRLL